MVQERIYNYFERNPQLHVLFIFDRMNINYTELEQVVWPDNYVYKVFDGAWFTGDWSDELIMLVNLTGNHGGIQAGTDVWGEGTREIALTYADDLKDYLRSAGIPVI